MDIYSQLTNWLFQKYGIRKVVWYEDMLSGYINYEFTHLNKNVRVTVNPFDLVTALDFNEIAKKIEAQLNVL